MAAFDRMSASSRADAMEAPASAAISRSLVMSRTSVRTCLPMHPCDRRSGKNVVEFVSRSVFQIPVKFLTWISVFWVEHAGCGAQIFRCSERVFFPPASAFHFLLRCRCGAMQFQIQFTLENRGFVRSLVDKIVSDAVEQFVRSAEIDARSAGKIMVLRIRATISPGGTAAAIAVSVQR